jgi:general secretion pathway protein A
MKRFAPLALSRDPFATAPDLAFMASTLGQRDALMRLDELVSDRLGLGFVSGERGIGKTITRLALAQALRDDATITLAELAAGIDSNTDVTFLRAVASALGAATDGRSSLDLTTGVIARLEELNETGHWPVMLIDDAHLLSSSQLELVRTIAGGEDEHNRATIVLFGEPELEERIVRRRALSKRLALRHTLNPLNRQDAAALLRHRLTVAGNADLFTAEALVQVATQARGNPRDLLALAGRAIERATQEEANQIDSAMIDRLFAVGERGVVTNQLGLFDNGSPRKRELARSGAGERVELNAS